MPPTASAAIVATCQAGGRDLAEEMVRAGFATVFTRQGFASPYEPAQQRGAHRKARHVGRQFRHTGRLAKSQSARRRTGTGGFNAREWLARHVCAGAQWLTGAARPLKNFGSDALPPSFGTLVSVAPPIPRSGSSL